jgi:Protein of unknown function (DUF1501)
MFLHPALTRRAFLQVGGSSFAGLALSELLAGRAAAETPRRSRSVILVLLTGGLSHLDSLDMKPDAPAEIRGEFGRIQTQTPGIEVCEHLPRLAQRMNRWAVVRSFSHRDHDHLPATHNVITGSPMPLRRPSDLDNVLSRRDFPCYGSVLSNLRPRHDGLPSGVTLPNPLIEGPLTWPGQHGGFLGGTHDPMLVTQDPNSPSFRIDALSMASGLDRSRLTERLELLDHVGSASPFRPWQEKALEVLTSGRAEAAFRLDRVPAAVRDRYGRNSFGQTLLLSRRLVEAGVPMIQANMGIVQTWDTHSDNWGRLKNRLLPWLDQGLAALVDDLAATGLLDETLIAVVGEFGRTPRISNLLGSPQAGRDHWSEAYSGMFAGAGVRGGQVIGRTDRIGAFPLTPPISPNDLGATIYRVLGLDPEIELHDSLGRPLRLSSGQVIPSLV